MDSFMCILYMLFRKCFCCSHSRVGGSSFLPAAAEAKGHGRHQNSVRYEVVCFIWLKLCVFILGGQLPSVFISYLSRLDTHIVTYLQWTQLGNGVCVCVCVCLCLFVRQSLPAAFRGFLLRRFYRRRRQKLVKAVVGIQACEYGVLTDVLWLYSYNILEVCCTSQQAQAVL